MCRYAFVRPGFRFQRFAKPCISSAKISSKMHHHIWVPTVYLRAFLNENMQKAFGLLLGVDLVSGGLLLVIYIDITKA